jgi:hypothetical protein
MTDELGLEARALIDRACREERSPDDAVLDGIKRRVVLGAASAGVLLGAGEAAAGAGESQVLMLLGLAAKGGAAGAAVAVLGYSVERAMLEPVAPRPARAVASVVAPRADDDAPAVPAVAEPPVAHEESEAKPAERGDTLRPSPAKIGEKASSAAVLAAPPSDEPALAVGSLPVTAALLEEVATLRRVQGELRAGRGREALRLLDESSSRLGRGQLRQERLAAEVFASCQSGELDRARAAARRLLAENPATPSAERLKSSCVAGELAPR